MADSENDLKLFQKIKDGDEKSFDKIFLKYYTSLCRFAYVILKNSTESEEIVQEVFINIWEGRGKLNIQTSFASYLCSAVRNKSLNYIKKGNTRKIHENEAGKENVSETIEMHDYSTLDSLHLELSKTIEQLPKKCRKIFQLSRNENMSNAEIAKHLGISVKTVENQMTIALKKIRINLAHYLTVFYFFIN